MITKLKSLLYPVRMTPANRIAGRIVLALPLACALVLSVFTGCAGESQSQVIAANGEAAGEAVGTYLLKQHSVGGVVDPTYLGSFQALTPKIAKVMAGAVTPADVHTLIADAKGVTLTSGQSTVVAYLDGLSPEFIATNGTVNGQAPTPDGALADAAAKQFSSGLARAVGLVTGTNFTPPTS
jgi:hypothetical protein